MTQFFSQIDLTSIFKTKCFSPSVRRLLTRVGFANICFILMPSCLKCYSFKDSLIWYVFHEYVSSYESSITKRVFKINKQQKNDRKKEKKRNAQVLSQPHFEQHLALFKPQKFSIKIHLINFFSTGHKVSAINIGLQEKSLCQSPHLA